MPRTHLNQFTDLLFPTVEQTLNICGIYFSNPGATKMRSLLVGMVFDSDKVDETAARDRISQYVL
jgi:hypothetical protein